VRGNPVAERWEGEGDNEKNAGDTSFALRLGFRQIKGMREEYADQILAARGNGYSDMLGLWRRAGLAPAVLERLARADAFGSMGLDRRQALWAVKSLGPEPLPLFAAAFEEEQGNEPEIRLPAIGLGEQVIDDYASLRLSLKAHPLSFLRQGLAEQGAVPNARLKSLTDGARVTLAGLVLSRQRPGTAKGVIFATLEDETGIANIIVWPPVYERYRRIVLGARLILVRGKLQRQGIVIHIIADKLVDLTHLLSTLGDEPGAAEQADPLALLQAKLQHKRDYPSRDFH